MSMRPSGDTARGLVFDDFVDKQVVHVSATSFRSGAERVSMDRQGQTKTGGVRQSRNLLDPFTARDTACRWANW